MFSLTSLFRVEDNTKLGKSNFQEMKEVVSDLADKTEKVVKETAKKTKKTVKKTVSKTKDMKFEDIKDMSNSAVKKLLKDVDIEEISLALKGAEKELTEKVIPNLSAKAKKTYDEIQSEVKKIKKSDISKYKKNIEGKIKNLFGK